jgi:hypothetical protein
MASGEAYANMQKDSAHSDAVWGLCAELLSSSDYCSVGQGAATLRSLLGIPVFRQMVARSSSAKCGVGSALPQMLSWPPATRCIHAALQLLFDEHSDERVLQDVLSSLQLLLAANFGCEAVVAVCGNGGPDASDKTSISLWQLISRLTVLSLHPIPSLACDAFVALSFLSSNSAGAAVSVLNRAAPLLCWQVACRCLQVISKDPCGIAAAPEDAMENTVTEEVIRSNTQELGDKENAQKLTGDTEPQHFPEDASPDDDSIIVEAEPLPELSFDPSAHSDKTFAIRMFMSDRIHGSCEHSFVVGCNVTSDAFLMRPGVAELLLYCSMHACINFCTVCMSLKRVPLQKSDPTSLSALFSCSFGCSSYAHLFRFLFRVCNILPVTLSAQMEWSSPMQMSMHFFCHF